jgi:predicted transcriptional regulator
MRFGASRKQLARKRAAFAEWMLDDGMDEKRNTTHMSDNLASSNYIELAADIVSAYVSNNSVPSADLASLISDVHLALVKVGGGTSETPAEAPKPAIPVKKSITPDYIVCLEDGKKFKSLKRHLRTQYNMTPEQYRERWGLPSDYPMVAPNYAKARSQLAKEMGLGQQRRKRRSRG